jgi:hypothetical protein
MDSSVSPKDKIWFLRVCHHITTGLYYEFKPLYVVVSIWDLNPSIVEGSTTMPVTGER